MNVGNIQSKVTLGKTELGNAVFNVKLQNTGCEPLFATVAASEKKGCADDMDTFFRDKRINPGQALTLEIPRCGNGAPEGALYRLSVHAACGSLIGSQVGVLAGQNCGCGAQI